VNRASPASAIQGRAVLDEATAREPARLYDAHLQSCSSRWEPVCGACNWRTNDTSSCPPRRTGKGEGKGRRQRRGVCSPCAECRRRRHSGWRAKDSRLPAHPAYILRGSLFRAGPRARDTDMRDPTIGAIAAVGGGHCSPSCIKGKSGHHYRSSPGHRVTHQRRLSRRGPLYTSPREVVDRRAATTSAVSALTRRIYVYKVVGARRAFRKPRTTPQASATLDIPGSKRKHRTHSHTKGTAERDGASALDPTGRRRSFLTARARLIHLLRAPAASARWVDPYDIRYFRYSQSSDVAYPLLVVTRARTTLEGV
jgi:hypothetical protein